MRFPYHQIDEDGVEVEGQHEVRDRTDPDTTFCPQRPLLLFWPRRAGLVQIAIGFLTLGFSVLDVFLVPLLRDMDNGVWSLNYSNCFGAALWSAIMLILAGSCAVRCSKTKGIIAVRIFYIVTVKAFWYNVTFMILILFCYQQQSYLTDNSELSPYSYISLLSSIFTFLGCLTLVGPVKKYFMPVMFGEVKLLRAYGVCWCPCCFDTPQSLSSSIQSVNSDDSNMIV